jgi:hypothetical protein
MPPLLAFVSLILFGPPKSAFAQAGITEGNEKEESFSSRDKDSEKRFRDLKDYFFEQDDSDDGDWYRKRTIKNISEISLPTQDIEDFLVMIVIDKKRYSLELRQEGFNSLLKVRGYLDPLVPILGGPPKNLWIQNLRIF